MTLFPDMGKNSDKFSLDTLKHEQAELVLVCDNEDAYARQFVGIILPTGRKMIFCNYAEVPNADPSTGYLFLEKVICRRRDGSFPAMPVRSRVEDLLERVAHRTAAGEMRVFDRMNEDGMILDMRNMKDMKKLINKTKIFFLHVVHVSPV